jgi:hypothetical protein
VTWTARKDVGTFVAHILGAVPLSELSNRVFRLQGDIVVRLNFMNGVPVLL